MPTILIVDDHQIVRDGLRLLLETSSAGVVVAEAEDGHRGVTLAVAHQPDVVIMDVGLPDLNGIDATQAIVSQCPTTKVVALSMRNDRRAVIEMFRAGAKAYLLKTSAFQELTEALGAVLSGRTYVSPSVAHTVVDSAISRAPTGAWQELSHREREILQLIAEGHSTKRIASKLTVSIKTVETHRKNLMDKLDLHSVAGLTRYAIAQGIVAVDGLPTDRGDPES